jgi:TolB protein
MNELLRHGLADLAEDVVSVDLYDGVVEESRRIHRRRVLAAALAAATALAVVAGGTAALAEWRPRSQQQSGDQPSPGVTSDPATTPSGAAPSVPSGSPASGSAPVTQQPASLLYAPASGSGTVRLSSWRPGTPSTEAGMAIGWESAALNVNFSPDGKQVSWVAGDDRSLYVAKANGTGQRRLRGDVDNMCTEPVWLPDGKRLLVRDGATGRVGYLTVATVAFHALPAEVSGCHFAFSADGRKMAYADGSGKLILANTDGTGRREIAGIRGTPGEYHAFAALSLSADGSRLATYRLSKDAQTHGDAARSLWANLVLDTRTGDPVSLPVTGSVRQALFRPDGSMLIRLAGITRNEVVLVSASGEVVWRHAEPASLKDQWLLGATT